MTSPTGGAAAASALLLDLEGSPTLPANAGDYGIASVGAGAIVNACHLPVYRRAGLRLAGVFDVRAEAAEATARAFELPRVYRSLEEVLEDRTVRVVDVAVPATEQAEIAMKVAAAGKHLLCQKPLAERYDQAVQVVEAARAAGVKLAVNQQMRWDPGMRAVKTLLDRGWLGQPFAASITVNVRTPWEGWPWLLAKPTHEIMYHSIHYLDSLRFLLGDPAWVFAHGAQFPGFPARGETRTLLLLEYAKPVHLRAVVHDEHHNTSAEDDWFATFRVEGTEGTAKGTIGALYDYPHGRPDTLTYTSRLLRPNAWITPRLAGRWFPDAFLGPMASLLTAIATGGEPETSGADNLGTLRLMFAAYRSMAERRTVPLAEEVAR